MADRVDDQLVPALCYQVAGVPERLHWLHADAMMACRGSMSTQRSRGIAATPAAVAIGPAWLMVQPLRKWLLGAHQ